MYYTIYKITNKVNGKIYIGAHKTENLNDGYMGSGKILKRAQQKYGIENFVKDIIGVFDTPEEMFAAESILVNSEFVASDDTYNLKVGGEGGWDYLNSTGLNNKNRVISECTKKKISDTIKSNPILINAKRKRLIEMHKSGSIRYDTFTGRTHNESTKKIIGEKNAIHMKGSGNSQFGTCWIYSLEEQRNLKINSNELNDWLCKGWIKGRKMKFA